MPAPALTVYHDGSCPLCRMEIGHFRQQAGADRIKFIDVSDHAGDLGPELTREKAMGRFHVRLPSGDLKSGGAALVEIWNVLPRWRGPALAARLPGVTPALDIAYQVFSPFRPTLARIVGRFSSV